MVRNTRINQSQLSSCRPGVNSSDGSALAAEDNELPNVGQSSAHTETRSNRKLVIAVEKDNNPKRFTNHTVTRDITKDLLSRMPSPAPRWQDYCPNMKDELFNGFLEKHEFTSNYDKAMARTIWNKTMLDRYPDILKRVRERAFKEANSISITDIKGHGLKVMKVDVWNGLVDHWLDSKWKNRSVAGQKKRIAMPAHKLHTIGSISFSEHKRRKEAKLKRRVSFLEVYDDVHKKKVENMFLKYPRKLLDVPLPEDTGVSTVKPVSQADITQAIKEALPSAINEVLPSVVNEAIQSNLLPFLSKIPGFSQEKDH
ncbi:hypothetical protein Ahy_A04g019114 [Arachis hypogaea]|uniref:Uncharacterized protein n=1 Tax=Arachis hypogaea TaxID=3818 RepID=A0A445DFC0_ARAHY|nr:hypothetical protein Ahy_A04g019114 [Arachis hypogaea]